MPRTPLTYAVLLALLAGCETSSKTPRQPAVTVKPTAAAAAESHAQLFTGMGNHQRRVTTNSALAQRYFNQGLTFAYAFNHDEAIRSFTEAARLDPDCAMAWWGIALCHGPHINNPAMSPEASAAAWAALVRATGAASASPTERALIAALSRRYADPVPADRRSLDEAYANAMRELWHANPTDADIGCLFAESMMDLRPWDLWTKAGAAQPGTEETVATIEQVLVLDPKHPGANHLYIHAVEASPYPERAVASANRLRTLVPAAGHLVHMPAHIDIRVGEWEKASESNRRAIVADAAYRKLSPQQQFYRLYMAHNHHFLAFASMMQGRREEALEAARDMIAGVPPEALAAQSAMLDPYMSIELDVLVRFGMWNEILAMPEPNAKLVITKAMWRFSRGVALAALGRIDEASSEQAAFREAVKAVPTDAMMAINPAHMVLSVAELMLDGEIDLAEKKNDAAIAAFQKAVAIEDDLKYMEPPDWLHPVRHPLGAVLLESGRAAEAEAVYRADLKKWPENGWSLLGLSRALKAQGKTQEAAAIDKRFTKAWAQADTKIGASCLCVKPRG